MFFSQRFICASTEKNEYEKHVNAPLFKREFDLQVKAKGRIQICGLGFYRIFLNGKELTREQTYKVLHCYICDKIHINNSYRYCSSCKYFVKELFLK